MHSLIERFIRHLLFAAFLGFAAAAPPLAGAASSDPGAGAGGGGGAPAGGQGGSVPTAGQGGQPGGQGQAGTQPQPDQNIRQLREAYDGLKAKHEPFEKLGLQADQIGQFHGVYQKVYGEVASLGRELGYPDDEIAEALAEDPVRTLDFLRNEAARTQAGQQGQGGQGQDLADLVAQQVDQAIGPIQQRENIRMTNEANALFERTVHQMAVDSFKAEGIDVANIPQDEMFMLTSACSEILKYDENALRALKYEGKTAAIQKAFQEARTYLDKYYLARAGRERTRIQPPNNNASQGGQQQSGQQKKPTLDEMIDNPGVINAKYR